VTGQMTPEEFRRHGYEVIDWIANYYEKVEAFPVLSPNRPGEVRRALPERPPEHGEPFSAVLADVDQVILPGITHWQHPSFFAFYPANASGPAILGDLLSSGLGVQGMLWATSPACTELEAHVLDWLAELLDLPERFRSTSSGGGVIQDSASSAALVALVAALHRASGGTVGRNGVDGRFTVYASREAHSATDKAVRIAGLGTERLRRVDVDPDTQQMRPEHLAQLLQEDRRAGSIPAMVVATMGTTSTCAVDPLPGIAELCARYGAWLHVDAAYAGVAAICPELRWLNDGLAGVDSYCTNPHKWLLTNFDCDAFYVSDRRALIDSLSVLPEFLRNAATESGEVIDYRDWQISLGRRFRALKLWCVLRWFGAEGLRTHIREHLALARELADWIEADERFELVVPPRLGLVCFRLRADDGANARLVEKLNTTGEIYLTHTKVNGRYVVRVAIGGALTRRRHVEAAWRLIQRTAGGVDISPSA
jgi:aromatic-L-amino-acid/L-tryptophan decarboxylase